MSNALKEIYKQISRGLIDKIDTPLKSGIRTSLQHCNWTRLNSNIIKWPDCLYSRCFQVQSRQFTSFCTTHATVSVLYMQQFLYYTRLSFLLPLLVFLLSTVLFIQITKELTATNQSDGGTSLTWYMPGKHLDTGGPGFKTCQFDLSYLARLQNPIFCCVEALKPNCFMWKHWSQGLIST